MRDVIKCGHALNFDELNKVTILVRVALIFMDGDGGVLALVDVADDKLFRRFSVLVRNHELGSIIEEGVAGKTQVLRENIADSV